MALQFYLLCVAVCVDAGEGSWPRLPASIGACDQLESLRLNSNLFDELPESLTCLTRLVYLNLSLNKLTTFPGLVSTEIRTLCFEVQSSRGSRLTCRCAAALTTLTELHINGSDFATMPENIGALALLQKFTLRYVCPQQLVPR